MATRNIRTEGGSGGKLGHSNMEHWATTAEIKDECRTARRNADRAAIAEQLDDMEG